VSERKPKGMKARRYGRTWMFALVGFALGTAGGLGVGLVLSCPLRRRSSSPHLPDRTAFLQ